MDTDFFRLFPDPGQHPGLYAGGAALLLVLAVARRVPVLRTLVSLGSWLLLGGLAVTLLYQRAAFEPMLDRAMTTLRLDRQEVVGRETRVRLSSDGHFWVRATLNGVPQRLLVDSGATVTALSPKIAAAAGLEVSQGPVPVLLRTANGTVAAGTARVAELRLGNIVARDLPVVVSPGMGDLNVVGMNFLSRLKGWRVEEGVLVLTPHHPQGETAKPGV